MVSHWPPSDCWPGLLEENVANPIYVAECKFGRGVFAARDIESGAELLRFTGPVIGFAEALTDAKGNPLQIADALYMDIEPPGVLVNHSCAPNTGILEDYSLVALRAIKQGEEIRYDYSTTMWEDEWTMPCACGASRCRGVVRDFPELPTEIQAEYLRLGVVQAFIVRRLLLDRPVQ